MSRTKLLNEMKTINQKCQISDNLYRKFAKMHAIYFNEKISIISCILLGMIKIEGKYVPHMMFV